MSIYSYCYINRERQFRALIDQIRGMYDGSLTVATLYNQVSNTSNWPLIQWYDAIDIIGVDGKNELINMESYEYEGTINLTHISVST